jgi:nuclear transport factor 2 (NTF2) superfamily protein
MLRDPSSISKAYTDDSVWRNRDQFIVGTQAIVDLLTAKWEKEKSYRLRKELFAFTDNKIAVQFWYEYQDKHDGMEWKRCYGLEDWTFAEDGRMRKRQMSGNDVELSEEERWFKDGVDVNAVDISEKHW